MSNDNAAAAIKPGAASRGWLERKGARTALSIFGLLVLGSIGALSADFRYSYILVYLWFGLAYGVLLQYGRFCMASAVRDLFAVGVPRMAVGVMFAVVLYSLVAAAVQVAGFSTFHAHPLGWHIIIGGAIFGFGMIFTGGCASGSLYKTGEGNLASLLVVVAISFSQAVFVAMGSWSDRFVPESWTVSAAEKRMPESLSATSGWFDQFMAGYIWDLQGGTLAQSLGLENPVVAAFFGNAFLSAILPSLAIMGLLYVVIYRRGYMRRKKIERPTIGQHAGALWSMLTSSRNTALAGLGLGVFAGLHMWTIGAMRDHYGIFNFGELLADMGHRTGLSIQDTVFDPGYWYITTQEAQWGGWLLDKVGVENMDTIFFGLNNGIPNPVLNAPGFMSIGIILGAAMLALGRGEFKWKVPGVETAIFALVGGTLMGIGARIGMGCNIGAFFATVTNGDLSGWIFMAGMVAGGYTGVKVFNWWMERQAAKEGGLEL